MKQLEESIMKCIRISSMFCKENQLSIVGEYLVWYDFVQHAKKFDVPYYLGIDNFLKEYHVAVKQIVGEII